jgi:hypothetical protein
MLPAKLKRQLIGLSVVIAGFWVFAFLRPDFIFFCLPSKSTTGPYPAATSWSVAVAITIFIAALMASFLIANGHRNDTARSWRGWTIIGISLSAICIGVTILVISGSNIEKHQEQVCANSPMEYSDISLLDFRGQYCYNQKHQN